MTARVGRVTINTHIFLFGLISNFSTPTSIIMLFKVWFMVFNATFNNISVISGQSVLLVEEIGVPRENGSRCTKITNKAK
jgi:hypothetical protein